MVYVPRVGYLLAAEPWRECLESLPEEELDSMFPGLNFAFFHDGVPHFKTARCRELDSEIGDTVTGISERETSIVIQLTNFILRRSESLLDILHKASDLDCLL